MFGYIVKSGLCPTALSQACSKKVIGLPLNECVVIRMKTDNTEFFEHMLASKAVITLIIPTVISQIITVIYNMADIFFIGKMNDPNQGRLRHVWWWYTMASAVLPFVKAKDCNGKIVLLLIRMGRNRS